MTKALRARARRAGELGGCQQRRARSTPPPRACARRGVFGKAGVVPPPLKRAGSAPCAGGRGCSGHFDILTF